MKQLARALRKRHTDAEKVLWSRLRNRQLEGCKFRRQQVIGADIADFLCLDPKLVIELDGGQHAEHMEQDAQRTRYLQSLGYHVLRFWNHDVLCEPEACWTIRTVIALSSPHSNPLLEGRSQETIYSDDQKL